DSHNAKKHMDQDIVRVNLMTVRKYSFRGIYHEKPYLCDRWSRNTPSEKRCSHRTNRTQQPPLDHSRSINSVISSQLDRISSKITAEYKKRTLKYLNSSFDLNGGVVVLDSSPVDSYQSGIRSNLNFFANFFGSTCALDESCYDPKVESTLKQAQTLARKQIHVSLVFYKQQKRNETTGTPTKTFISRFSPPPGRPATC
ncbi:hypothetical protein CLF_111977, partial [Clonorchis sinensis]